MRLPSSLRASGAFALLLACATPPTPLPDIDTTGMEPAVKERIASARQAVADKPDSAEAWGELGMVLHVHELHAPAIIAYRHAHERDPEDVRWPYFLGHVLSAQGTDLADAIAAYRAAIALRPEYAPARLRLATALVASGDSQAALEAYERALALAPDLGPAYLGRGQALLQMNRPAQAVTALRRAVELLPNSPTALYALSRAYLRDGQPEAAEAAADRAKQVDGVDFFSDPLMRQVREQTASSTLLWEKARGLLSAGDLAAAIPLLQRVAEMRPESARIHHQLGAALQTSGQLQPAIRELTRALELDPQQHEARMQLIVALLDAKRPTEALSQLRAVRGQRSDDPIVYALFGRAHLLRDEPTAAADAFQAAAAVGPLPAWAQDGWGSALARQGRFASAIPRFEKALATQPENPEILVHLGLACEGMGRTQEAVEYYRRAQASEPNPFAAARLSVLTSGGAH